MSSNQSHTDVQQELEGLSPLLANLRAQKASEQSAEVDMDVLQALGQIALQAVPLEEELTPTAAPLRVIHRKRKWVGLVAAAVAMLLGALISYSVYTSTDSDNADFVLSNSALSEELIASFEEQTADPIAFLLEEEVLYAEEESFFFSPAEDVLLDWADDGNVDEALSEEIMIDALW